MLLCSPQKTKLKLGKSLPLGVETAGSGATRSPRRSFRKGERREPSWAGKCCSEQGRGAALTPKGAHGPHHRPLVCPRRGRRQWELHAVAGVPGFAQLLGQPGPGLPILGQHSCQPLDGGESSLRRPHGIPLPAARLIPPHPSCRAIGRAWGAARQSCRPSP